MKLKNGPKRLLLLTQRSYMALARLFASRNLRNTFLPYSLIGTVCVPIFCFKYLLWHREAYAPIEFLLFSHIFEKIDFLWLK